MSRVTFIEDGHKYMSPSGQLTSVSEFVKGFEPKKNWTDIAKKRVKKLKEAGIVTTVDAVLAEWETKRVLGSSAGTMVHKKKEEQLLQDSSRNIKQPFYEGVNKLSFAINELEDNTIYPELMIYDFDAMICGQSDEVHIDSGIINVYDTKTDKEIKFQAYRDKWTKPEKLLPPLSHLDNCNGNIYSLKMSLYMYLIWKANKGRYKPGKIILNWCPIERDKDGIPVLYKGSPRILEEVAMEIPYRKKEVMDMINTTKNGERTS